MSVAPGSTSTAGAQRAGERLERRLDHVVRVRARLDLHVQRQLGRARDRAEELLGEVGVEALDRARGQLALEDAERPAGDVDRRRRARLVHRHGRLAEAGDARAVAERLVERLAEHDADVLDGVVRAGLEVARRGDVEVERRRGARPRRACGRRSRCRWSACPRRGRRASSWSRMSVSFVWREMSADRVMRGAPSTRRGPGSPLPARGRRRAAPGRERPRPTTIPGPSCGGRWRPRARW